MNNSVEKENNSLGLVTVARVISKIIRLSWNLDKAQVVFYAIGSLLEIAGTLLITYAGARLVSLLFTAIQNPDQRAEVWLWLGGTILGQLMISIGFWLMSYSAQILYILASKWSSITFMRQLCSIDIQMFHDTDSRNLINKLDSGHGWQISAAVTNSLNLVYGIFRSIAIIAVIATVAWWIAPFLMLFLIPSLIAESKTAKSGWFVWNEKGDERHVFWGISYLMTRPKSQLEIRALQAKDSLTNIIDRMIEKFQLKQRNILKRANRFIAPAKVIEVIGIALAEIWLIFRLLYQNNLSLTAYIFYSGIIARVNGSLITVFSTYTGMQEVLLYARDYYKFMEIKPAITDREGAIKVPNQLPKIEFKNVWFKYPGTDRWIFENLNLVIEPGEHFALVGENGVGKTTLVKLLLRFYDVDEGSIQVNGVNLKDLNLNSWYSQLGTLFQDFNGYPLDIKNNITISQPGKLDDERLTIAIKESGVDEIVKKMPYGLETVLDSSFKKGIEPSGGQWQRVALARAFYRNPNVLILDEPTAAIDAKAEYTIFNSIFKNQKQKSAIIISHRFSTVRRADKIIVLDKGKIVEQGSHIELMKANGLYKEMFDRQAEGYK